MPRAKKQQQNLGIVWVVLAAVIIVAAVAIIYARPAIQQPDEPQPVNVSDIVYETQALKDTDFLDDSSITSLDINVLGVGLGDTQDKLISMLGEPDLLVNPEFTPKGVENWGYYSSTLGLREEDNRTGIVFNIDQGMVRRISVYQPASDVLPQDMVFRMTFAQLLDKLGAPQVDEDRAGLMLRKIGYTDKGLEMYLDRGVYVTIFVFTLPL